MWGKIKGICGDELILENCGETGVTSPTHGRHKRWGRNWRRSQQGKGSQGLLEQVVEFAMFRGGDSH